MKKRTLLIILIPLLSIFALSSCKKRQLRWMEYKETQCADAWGDEESDADIILALENYFFNLGAPLKEVEFRADNSLYVCAACGCYTGRIIEVQVHKDHENILIEHGFTKMED
jgi:hypothetical protein